MTKVKVQQWYNTREGLVITFLVSLLAAYIIASRAIDTGSLIQYFLTLILFGFAVNRLVSAIKGK